MELLPLIHANSKYKMEADKGTQLTYDLAGIQKQVEDRFIIGRPLLYEKIEQLSFRQDFRNSVTFQRIRKKIRQVTIEKNVSITNIGPNRVHNVTANILHSITECCSVKDFTNGCISPIIYCFNLILVLRMGVAPPPP